LDIVLLLKTIQKLKASISVLMTEREDMIDKAKKIYSRQIIIDPDEQFNDVTRSISFTEQ